MRCPCTRKRRVSRDRTRVWLKIKTKAALTIKTKAARTLKMKAALTIKTKAARTIERIGEVTRRIGKTPKARNHLMTIQTNFLISAEEDKAFEVGENRATTLVLG